VRCVCRIIAPVCSLAGRPRYAWAAVSGSCISVCPPLQGMPRVSHASEDEAVCADDAAPFLTRSVAGAHKQAFAGISAPAMCLVAWRRLVRAWLLSVSLLTTVYAFAQVVHAVCLRRQVGSSIRHAMLPWHQIKPGCLISRVNFIVLACSHRFVPSSAGLFLCRLWSLPGANNI
jgi:hypothetical protein